MPEPGAPHPRCACCFNLDAPTAIQYDGDRISHDKKGGVVRLRRKWGQLDASARQSGCQVCFVIIEASKFFGLDLCDMELRLPTQAAREL